MLSKFPILFKLIIKPPNWNWKNLINGLSIVLNIDKFLC